MEIIQEVAHIVGCELEYGYLQHSCKKLRRNDLSMM
jgi:hypothetical protein